MKQGFRDRLAENFRLNLARARHRRNMTQDQVADELGLTKNAVNAWESGRSFPEFERLMKLPAILGVSLADLFGDEFDQKPGPDPEEVMAEKVAVRVGEILRRSPDGQFTEHDWDRFLQELNITKLSQEALVPVSVGGEFADSGERDQAREALAKLPPRTLERLVRTTAELVVERLKEFGRRKGQ